MPIGKVWIYRLLLVCLCVGVFVRLWISPLRIKLTASHFARRFIGVQGSELNNTFWRTSLPQKPKIGRIGQRVNLKHDDCSSWWLDGVAIMFAWCVDVGSACVDIRQYPKTDVLINSCLFLSRWTDLLEKSRAIRQAVDERSFHIFYEMLNCASADAKSMIEILRYPRRHSRRRG